MDNSLSTDAALRRIQLLEEELQQVRRHLGTVIQNAEARARRSHDLLRAMVLRQESERENERRRLAHGIHEDLAQNLMALRMGLALLNLDAQRAELPIQLEKMRQVVDSSIERLREMVSMIRPAALNMGIVVALRWLVDDFRKGSRVDIELHSPEELQLDDAVTTFLFRAAQEALLNTAMHANASRVEVHLSAGPRICELLVKDNGQGFDLDALRPEGAFGLIHMNEQARHLGGQVSINTCPGHGVRVRIKVPMA
jgi:signal transduction histidine kinase